MHNKQSSIWNIILSLLCFYLLYSLFGCAGAVSTSYKCEGDQYLCEFEVMQCVREPMKLTVNANIPSESRAYSIGKELNVGEKIYAEATSPWAYKSIDYGRIKGAQYTIPDYADRNVTKKDFLEITWTPIKNIEAIYIAYDSRATHKPTWFDDYEQITANGKPVYITVPLEDESTTPAGNEVYLEIWRLKQNKQAELIKNATSLKIPGNKYGSPGFKAGVINPAMYIVIFQPKDSDVCKANTEKSYATRKYCACAEKSEGETPSQTIKKAEDKTKDICESYIDNEKYFTYAKLYCGKIVCYGPKTTDCPGAAIVSKTTGLKIAPWSFPYNSEIEFNPTKYNSTANIKVKDKQYNNKKVSGKLDFEYLLDAQNRMHTMKLNSMMLAIEDIGDFKDISVVLMKPTVAKCRDQFPPWATPCNTYQIPKGNFVCTEACKEKGKTLLYITKNSSPIDIKINHTTRTFQIKGSMLTQIEIDGDKTPLDVKIDLTGHFLNFAPKAKINPEFPWIAECEEKMNDKPIILDASTSIDIYDALPTNPANYKWYEDYGMATEKLWGQGIKLTIAKYQLCYGIHPFTLVLEDNYGVVDTYTIKLEVRDTIPPKLYIPQDIYALQTSPQGGPMHLDIGKAYGNDSCSLSVRITNDAPPNLMFPSGVVTAVTWKADDGRGNFTTKVQNVYVFIAHYNIFHFVDLFEKMNASINKAQISIKDCENDPRCLVTTAPFAKTLQQLTEIMREMPIPEEQVKLRDQITEKLNPIMQTLNEADMLLIRSSEAQEAERMELRAAALENLERASALMREIIEMLR
jgi:hypothetical protein